VSKRYLGVMFYRILLCAGIFDGVQQNIVHPHSWSVIWIVIATALFWTLADREAADVARVSSAKQD
jgi:Mg2+/citrate symporter